MYTYIYIFVKYKCSSNSYFWLGGIRVIPCVLVVCSNVFSPVDRLSRN